MTEVFNVVKVTAACCLPLFEELCLIKNINRRGEQLCLKSLSGIEATEQNTLGDLIGRCLCWNINMS